MLPFLKDFDVIPLELPGRGKRIQEDLVKKFDIAADDLYNQMITKLRSGQFLIYGHSMGSYLGLRIANMLAKVNRYPSCMVLSGNAGPGIDKREKRYLLAHERFMEELKRLGGVPREVYDHEELLNFLLPILRADFEIAEENGLECEPAVNVPIFAIMGDEEDYVNEISNWKRFTYSRFDYKVLSGGHFFIFNHPCEIANIIKKSFTEAVLLKR